MASNSLWGCVSMSKTSCDDFQATVDQYLVRHRSIVDVLSKLQEGQARISRAVAKAVTTCGCIRIHADRQQVPPDVALKELSRFMSDHLEGSLCEMCRETLEGELGRHLFYLAALGNLLGLSLDEVMAEERGRLETLRHFNCS